MKSKEIFYLTKNQLFILFFSVMLVFPALIVHLGTMPLTTDEPTRALVTLEMKYSGNLITPTINGEPYYNKPPLYNWILLATTSLGGEFSPFWLRLPTVISLMIFAALIFFFLYHRLGFQLAWLNSMMLITSARILWWDSFQALIDVFFSLVIFSNFLIIYHFSEKEKWNKLFLLSWIITALAFLLKGFPALVFQSLTLIVWCLYKRKFNKLFSWSNILSFVLFLIITGSYYLLYYFDNHTVSKALLTLFHESEKRATAPGLWENSPSPLIKFPFLILKEFAPWSVFIIFLFVQTPRKLIRENTLVAFCLLVFIVNILPYWISPDFRPRYIFMLMPLLFIPLSIAWEKLTEADSIWVKGFNRLIYFLFVIFAFVLLMASISGWLNVDLPIIAGMIVSAVILFGLAILSLYQARNTVYFLVFTLLLGRIIFNYMELPRRSQSFRENYFMQEEIRIGKQYKNLEIKLIDNTLFDHDASFYLSKERGCILPRDRNLLTLNGYYLADQNNLNKIVKRGYNYRQLDYFLIKLRQTPIYLIYIEKTPQ